MRIIKCDKCGTEIQEDKDRLYKVYKDNGDEPVTFDYCDICYPQLVTWIMTKGTFSTTDTPMSERQVLEKFEKWYVEYSKCYGSSMDFARYRLMTNGTYAVDKYIEKLKKND